MAGTRKQTLLATLGTQLTCLFSLTVPLPRHRLHGCACTSPLAHSYVHHAKSSIRELHPFTTITYLASENRLTPEDQDDIMIQFLFRKRGRHVQPSTSTPVKDGSATALLKLFSLEERRKTQWTDRLAGLADIADFSEQDQRIAGTQILEEGPSLRVARSISGPTDTHPVMELSLRLEGPYFTPADATRYNTVICLVAGTGISGAIAFAAAFADNERVGSRPGCISMDCDSQSMDVSAKGLATREWKKCVIVWSVREADYADLPSLRPGRTNNLEFRVQLTGDGRPRLNMSATLSSICADNPGTTWVYLSGSEPFILAGEKACKDMPSVEYYGARW